MRDEKEILQHTALKSKALLGNILKTCYNKLENLEEMARRSSKI
jgi:hypothetical protein